MTAYSSDHARKRFDPGYLNWINVEDGPGPEFAGRHALICFFSSSSVPCLQALRLLDDLLPSYAPLLVVAGIYTPRFDRERDANSVRRAVSRLSLRFPVAHDSSGEFSREHDIDTLPTFVILRDDGEFARVVGEPDVRRLRGVLERLLASAGRGLPDASGVRFPGEGAGAPAPISRCAATDGTLRYPTVIKPLPGAHQRWAVADCGHHQIVLLDDQGVEQVRFGDGGAGHRDGDASHARFHSPHGLVCSADAIYVADTGNHLIRRIDVTERRVVTVAGTGRRGYGLPLEPRDAASSPLSSPWDLELDGTLVFFSNAGSHQIGIFNCLDTTVRRLAGSGEAGVQDGLGRRARLSQPAYLALEDSGDRLFFTDSDSGAVRALTLDETARVSTLSRLSASEGGELLLGAKLQYPLGLAWSDGSLLVADCYNDRVLQLPATGERAPRALAVPAWAESLPRLCEPMGVYAEDEERVLVVDTSNHRILHYLAGREEMERWPRS